jgi:hypothetical protein
VHIVFSISRSDMTTKLIRQDYKAYSMKCKYIFTPYHFQTQLVDHLHDDTDHS